VSFSSNSKFGTILRLFEDRENRQLLLIRLGVRLSEPPNFEFAIAAINAFYELYCANPCGWVGYLTRKISAWKFIDLGDR
jgi:hypothetical protein